MATLVHTIDVHKSDVNWCSFSTKYLATCSGDKTVRLWNIDDFSEVSCSPLNGHEYYVHCCCFSPFGTLLASCSTDGKIIIWDPKTGDKQSVLSHKSKAIIRVCVFSPNSQFLVSGGADNMLCLWDVSTRKCVRVFEGHENTVESCSFTPDSNYLVSGSSDGDIRVWDARFGQSRCLFYTGNEDVHELGVSCIVCSPTFGTAKTSEAVDEGNDNNRSFAASNPGLRHFLMATCGGDNLVKLWDLYTEPDCTVKLRCILEGHSGTVMACTFSLDGKMLASGSGDMTVILWDPLKGEMLQAIDAHPRYITSCAFSVDGQYLASGSNDRTCRVWKLHLGPSAPPAEAADIKVDLLGCGGNKISPIKPLSDWSVQDVCDWLKSLGLEQYVVTFKSNEIDGQELNNITSEVLRSDLAISALGHRNKIIRGIESIKEQCILEQLQGQTTSDSDIPDELLCPITRELMRDPVIASDGYSYERSSIESWITSGKNTSPMTNSPLPNTVLMPNRMLKMLIQRQESK